MRLKDQPGAVRAQSFEGTSRNSQTRHRPHAAFWQVGSVAIAMAGFFVFTAGVAGASPAPKSPASGAVDGSSGAPSSPGFYPGFFLAQATTPEYGSTDETDYSQPTNPDYGANLNPDYGANTFPTDEQITNPDYGANALPTDEQITNPDYGQNFNPDYGENLNPGDGMGSTREPGANIDPKFSDGTAWTESPREKTAPAVKKPGQHPVKTTVKKTPEKGKKVKRFKLEKFKSAWKKFKMRRKKKKQTSRPAGEKRPGKARQR